MMLPATYWSKSPKVVRKVVNGFHAEVEAEGKTELMPIWFGGECIQTSPIELIYAEDALCHILYVLNATFFSSFRSYFHEHVGVRHCHFLISGLHAVNPHCQGNQQSHCKRDVPSFRKLARKWMRTPRNSSSDRWSTRHTRHTHKANSKEQKKKKVGSFRLQDCASRCCACCWTCPSPSTGRKRSRILVFCFFHFCLVDFFPVDTTNCHDWFFIVLYPPS